MPRNFFAVPGALDQPIDPALPRDQKIAILAGMFGQIAAGLDPDGAAGRIGQSVVAGSQGIVQNNILQREQAAIDGTRQGPQRPVTDPAGQAFGGFGGLDPAQGQLHQQRLAQESFGGLGAIDPQGAQQQLQRQRNAGGTATAASPAQSIPEPDLSQLPQIHGAEAAILGPEGVQTVNNFLRQFAQQVHTFQLEKDQFRQEMELMRQRQEFDLEQIRARADASVDVSERTGEIAANQARAGLVGAQTQGQLQQNEALTPELLREDVQSQIGLRTAQANRINTEVANEANQTENPTGIMDEEIAVFNQIGKFIGLGDNRFDVLGTDLGAIEQLSDKQKNEFFERAQLAYANGILPRLSVVQLFNPNNPVAEAQDIQFTTSQIANNPRVQQVIRETMPNGAVFKTKDGKKFQVSDGKFKALDF